MGLGWESLSNAMRKAARMKQGLRDMGGNNLEHVNTGKALSIWTRAHKVRRSSSLSGGVSRYIVQNRVGNQVVDVPSPPLLRRQGVFSRSAGNAVSGAEVAMSCRAEAVDKIAN